MAMIPAYAQSSLAQALAGQLGTAMKDLDAVDVLNAARKVQKAYRSYATRRSMPAKKRMRTKGKLEKRVTTGVTNTSEKRMQPIPTGPAFAFSLGELVISDFDWPFSTNNQANIRHRENNIIHVKGIKICRHFQYAAVAGNSNDIGPIEVHWALLQLKNDEDNTELQAELIANFFRDNSNNTTSSRDFPTYTTSSDWDMGLNCLPINPNNKVNVLTHTKRTLIAANNESQAAGKNIWMINKYMKVDKTFSFKDNTSGLPSRRIFECFWCNTVTPYEFPTDPSAIQYIESDRMNTVYYANDVNKCC